MSKDIETIAQAQETLVQQIESACDRLYEETITDDEYCELVEFAKDENNKSIQAIIERDIIGDNVVEDPRGDKMPTGENETYDIGCYMRVGRNSLRDEQRQVLNKVLYGDKDDE